MPALHYISLIEEFSYVIT